MKESQSISRLCFHDHLALINKQKKECLGISLVPGKLKNKAVEAKWQFIWIYFEKDVSVPDSKEKRIMTILFGWYFHLASVQFLLYVFNWVSSFLIFLNVTQYEWHLAGFVYLFKTFDLWKQSKTFAFSFYCCMCTCSQLWVKKALTSILHYILQSQIHKAIQTLQLPCHVIPSCTVPTHTECIWNINTSK